MRIARLMSVPVAILLGLGTVSVADAARKNTCDARIFQGETQACYEVDGIRVLFERPLEEALDGGDQAEGFLLNGAPCGCQLGKRTDFICVGAIGDRGGPDRLAVSVSLREAAIGRVSGNGRTIRGEAFLGGRGFDPDGPELELRRAPAGVDITQQKFTARRVDVSECFQAK